jgi:mannose-6-phosphate isomerase-like protein (cupin superfamily)
MKVRRVVTGHDEKGKAVFAGDEEVEPITLSLLPGAEFYRLWGADEAPSFPDSGTMPAQNTYFPPVDGFRFGLFTVAPAGGGTPADTELDVPAALAELEEKLPGLAGYMEPEEPGMHTTPTIDFEVVLSGEVILELDDGAEVLLRQGDTVVQNGTRHRWRNPGREPARMAVFIVGAHHDKFGI